MALVVRCRVQSAAVLAPTERRAHARHAIDLRVILYLGQTMLPGRLAELSQGGMFVRSALLPERARAVLTLRIAGIACVAKGRIVRDSHVPGFGVAFETMNERMQRFLADFSGMRAENRPGFLHAVLDPAIDVL